MYSHRSMVLASVIAIASLTIAPLTAIAETSDASMGIASALPEAAPVKAVPSEPNSEPLQQLPEAKLDYTLTEVKDASGGSHISAGAQFPVTIQKQISSKTAKVGDLVEAQLAVDLKIGERMIAPKQTTVLGHVIAVEKSRRLIKAEMVANKRWMRMSGSLGVQFDEIVTEKGDHIPLVAIPATKARVIKDKAEGRVLGVNSNGDLASPLSSQVKSQAIHMALRAGASAAGPFSFGAVPVAFALLGAVSPSFAFCHAVGTDVKHRRLKGFGMGLIQGLPGGFLLSDSIIRGPEATIEPGDVFQAQFKQDFTGEKATTPTLPANVDANVRGEVLPVQK